VDQAGGAEVALSPEEVESDAQLVLAIQAGDTAAFAELFQRHYPSVRRLCLRQLMDMTEADEVAQATFVRAFERIDRCTGPRNFGGWVHVIAQRLCVDAVRVRRRVRPEELPLGADHEAPGSQSPEDVVIRQERVVQLRAALAALPDRQRDVVVARDVHDRRPAEIAAALGITIGAVDSVLLRGRRRLALVYNQLASERGATATTTSAASLASGSVVLQPGGFSNAMGSLMHALAAVARAAETAAVQVGSAAGFLPQRIAVGRKIAAAVVGIALTVVPMAQSPRPDHHSVRTAAPVPASPAIPQPTVTTLPDAPAAPAAPGAPAEPGLPPAVVPEVPALSSLVGGMPAPNGAAPVDQAPAPDRRPSTGDIIEAIQRVLGTLPAAPAPPPSHAAPQPPSQPPSTTQP
jgi:RNA polymerase sigma-70 factor (ECF subfamily)